MLCSSGFELYSRWVPLFIRHLIAVKGDAVISKKTRVLFQNLTRSLRSSPSISDRAIILS